MRYLLILYCLCLSLAYGGTIYKSIDKNGVVIYSDQPIKGGKTVQLHSPNSYHKMNKDSVSLGPSSPLKKPVKKTPSYTAFAIDSPADQQSFHNQSRIPVSIKIEPTLKKNDKIQLLLDHQPYGKAEAATQFSLDNIDRGEHTLAAKLINGQGETIMTTSTITLYVHRTALQKQSSPLVLPLNSPAQTVTTP